MIKNKKRIVSVLVDNESSGYSIERVKELKTNLYKIRDMTDVELVCITESFIPNEIGVTQVLPEIRKGENKRFEWEGWWIKAEVFNYCSKVGSCLYVDLDTVFFGLPDNYFLKDKGLVLLDTWNKVKGGSVGTGFMWINLEKECLKKIYKEYIIAYLNRVAGKKKNRWKGVWEQLVLEKYVKREGIKYELWQNLFPGELASYKNLFLRNKGTVDTKKVKVLYFHGNPRPWKLKKQHPYSKKIKCLRKTPNEKAQTKP